MATISHRSTYDAQLAERRCAMSVLAIKVGVTVGLCTIWVASCAYRVSVHSAASSTSPVTAAAAHSPPPRATAVADSEARPTAAATARPRQPSGGGSEAACYAQLHDAGVGFEEVPATKAPGVAWPIDLTTPIDGVRIQGGGKKNAPTNYLDCRLARALLEWAPALRDSGVVGLVHMSAYRRDAVVAGSTQQSGHASGQAIDVGRFQMRDGTELSVLDDWTNRDRGADPCREWRTDNDAARVMRKLVCDAVERDVFQMALTPHYNDAHKNHVHLELRSDADSGWVN